MTALLREVIGDVLRRGPDRAGTHAARGVRRRPRQPRLPLRGGARPQGGLQRAARAPSAGPSTSRCRGCCPTPARRWSARAGPRRRGAGQRGQHRRRDQGRHPAGRVDGGGLSLRCAKRRRGVASARTDKLAVATTSRAHPGQAQLDDTKAERTHGQPVHQGVEVPHGAVQLQGRRVRRPEGADPAGHRGSAASAPGADPAGRPGDRQPASAGDAAEPPARRHREAAGQRASGADAGRSGHRRR